MKPIVIEIAKKEDADRLLEIYAPYVINTAITFEYVVPSIGEFTARIEAIKVNYPYLVAKVDDEIVGYAYTSFFGHRAAYQWAVETSIYVDQNFNGRGIGSALYQALETISIKQNVINMNACITASNPLSIKFHEKLGYQKVAHFNQCGFKLDKWHDVIWMEKVLTNHPIKPEAFIPFSQLIFSNDESNCKKEKNKL